jgi:hypothetical protein
MAFVLIDAANSVTAVFGGPQSAAMPDYQVIADDDPRLVAFEAMMNPIKPQQITSTAFLNRIPPAALPLLWGNPQTGILLITLAAANMIDLTDPAVQGGINGLVPSILTAQQAVVILDH